MSLSSSSYCYEDDSYIHACGAQLRKVKALEDTIEASDHNNHMAVCQILYSIFTDLKAKLKYYGLEDLIGDAPDVVRSVSSLYKVKDGEYVRREDLLSVIKCIESFSSALSKVSEVLSYSSDQTAKELYERAEYVRKVAEAFRSIGAPKNLDMVSADDWNYVSYALCALCHVIAFLDRNTQILKSSYDEYVRRTQMPAQPTPPWNPEEIAKKVARETLENIRIVITYYHPYISIPPFYAKVSVSLSTSEQASVGCERLKDLIEYALEIRNADDPYVVERYYNMCLELAEEWDAVAFVELFPPIFWVSGWIKSLFNDLFIGVKVSGDMVTIQISTLSPDIWFADYLDTIPYYARLALWIVSIAVYYGDKHIITISGEDARKGQIIITFNYRTKEVIDVFTGTGSQYYGMEMPPVPNYAPQPTIDDLMLIFYEEYA